MKRESPPSQPKDEAVALAKEAKRQRPNEANKKSKDGNLNAAIVDQLPTKTAEAETKAEKIPYQDVLRSKNRHRLPDKIMRCLCDGIEPDVLWWSPHENGFTVDADTVQEKLLDVHFRGTKLSSLVRSLNRWGFRRDFYRTLPKKALAFLHPQFQKGKPHLLRDMKICSSTTQVVDSSDDEEEETKNQASASSGSSDGSGGGKPSAAAVVQPNVLGSAHAPNELRLAAVAQQQQQVAAAAAAASISGAGLFHNNAGQTAGAGAGAGAGAAAGLLAIPQGQLAAASLLHAQAQQAQQLLNPQLSLLQQVGLLQPSTPNTLSAANQLLPGNSFRDAALVQVRAAPNTTPQDKHRSVTNSLLANVLARTGITSGIPSISPSLPLPNQQQLMQQQQQQDQMSALLQLQALRGEPIQRNQNQQLQLQELVLAARQREDTLRMLQFNQLQQLNPAEQGAIAASLSSTGLLPQSQSQAPSEQQQQQRRQQLQLQQQQQQQQLQLAPGAQQSRSQGQDVTSLNDPLRTVVREREQMNTQIMAMMQRQIQSGRGGEGKTNDPNERAPLDP